MSDAGEPRVVVGEDARQQFAQGACLGRGLSVGGHHDERHAGAGDECRELLRGRDERDGVLPGRLDAHPYATGAADRERR